MNKKTIIYIAVMSIIIIILAVASVLILKGTNDKSKNNKKNENFSNNIVNEIDNNNVSNENIIGNEEEKLENKPYIPEGFTHKSGTDVETGYVITDKNDNEYVWIPVKNGSLTRNTSRDKKYEDLDMVTTGLINSVSKYHGFYIARYEASQAKYKGKTVAASVKNVIPWINATYEEAYNAAYDVSKTYEYSDIVTGLVSSYAWDTTLAWINKTEANYGTNTGYGNYSGTILKTGETESDQVNSICDLAGNVKEWTTEKYDPGIVNDNKESDKSEDDVAQELSYRVIRGGGANISKSASSHIGQNSILTDSYLGFRIVLYKNN